MGTRRRPARAPPTPRTPARPTCTFHDAHCSLGVVTPHANFLVLPRAATEALANLRGLARAFDAYDDRYGFRDSVDVSTGRVSDFVLALDRGMITAALAQQLRPGLLQAPFRTGGFTSRARPLVREVAVLDLIAP